MKATLELLLAVAIMVSMIGLAGYMSWQIVLIVRDLFKRR